jgi:hypothetical protein
MKTDIDNPTPSPGPAIVRLEPQALEAVIAPQGIINTSRLPVAPLPAGIIKT